MAEAAAMTKRGGSRARRNLRSRSQVEMLPALKHGLPYVEPISADQVEQIHNASMAILEEIGVDFRDPIAPGDWKRAGADVEGDRVRIDRDLLMELISSIPETITLHARDPEKTVEFGGNSSIFVPFTGAPFIRDLEDKRRWGTLPDLNMLHKLAHMCPAIHSTAHVLCEPMDKPVNHRHLWITYSSMIHSDKTFMGMSTSGPNGEDVMDMIKILFGADFVDTHPVTVANVNGNSPLVWDDTMTGALRAFARHNQPVLCSPFTLAGANTPASMVPTVAQFNAEALAAMAYTQVVRKGAPAIYGHFLATVSMQSGAPMAGTPEISLMNFITGQLARRYKVPWRTTMTSSGSKILDAQAGYETGVTMMSCVLSGANYLWHSTGWAEAGLHCSVAKFLTDAEQCEMIYRMAEGPRWDDFDEALAAIRDVGPGGHYLGHPHTLENFQRAYFTPKLLDNNSIEQWEAEGSKDITARALDHARKLLSEYEQPAFDEAKNEELLAFVARREKEIPGDVS